MKVLIPDAVLTQNLDGEAVLLDLQSEQYFGLDAVGSAMWHTLAQTDSVEAAIQDLQATFEVDAAQLQQDVRNLIEQLREQGLLEVVEA